MSASPARKATIGLAMVEQALVAAGGTLNVRLTDRSLLAVEQVSLPFYDPGNTRQRAAAEGVEDVR